MRWIWLIVLVLGVLACGRSVEDATPTATPEPLATIAPMPTPATLTGVVNVVAAATLETVINCSVTGDLNVREEPYPNAVVIGWLRKGGTVTVGAEMVGGWRELVSSLGTNTGYAHGAYLDCK